MDPVVVFKLIESDPKLLYWLGVPLGLIYLYGILKGINDKKGTQPAVAPIDWSQSTVHLQGPFEKMIAALDRMTVLLRDIHEAQKDAARTLERTQEDQLRQTSQHNAHMDDLKRMLSASMRYDRRFGDRDN